MPYIYAQLQHAVPRPPNIEAQQRVSAGLSSIAADLGNERLLLRDPNVRTVMLACVDKVGSVLFQPVLDKTGLPLNSLALGGKLVELKQRASAAMLAQPLEQAANAASTATGDYLTLEAATKASQTMAGAGGMMGFMLQRLAEQPMLPGATHATSGYDQRTGKRERSRSSSRRREDSPCRLFYDVVKRDPQARSCGRSGGCVYRPCNVLLWQDANYDVEAAIKYAREKRR